MTQAAASLPRAVVLVILALAGAEPQTFRQRRAGGVALGVRVERRLIAPQFKQRQLVGVERALENLELLAARFLHTCLAARLHRPRQFGPLAGRGGDRDDESDGHVFLPDAGRVSRLYAGARHVSTVYAGLGQRSRRRAAIDLR